MDISNESEPKCLSSQEPAIQKLFGSSSIFKTPEFKRDRHMHGNLIIKDKANTQWVVFFLLLLFSQIFYSNCSWYKYIDLACVFCSYQAGMEAVDQLDFERAVTSFTKAITLQPEQVDAVINSNTVMYI